MRVKLEDGMKFKHKFVKDGNEFYVKSYDYYDDGEPIWVAVSGNSIYPLDEICLDNYAPMIHGKWADEKVEYEF